jgi:hypothetical protein
MKVIINTINFYNNVIINHVHDKTMVNGDKRPKDKTDEDDLSGSIPLMVINDNNDHPLIAQLE